MKKDTQGNEIIYQDNDVVIKWYLFNDHSTGLQCFSDSGNTKGMMLDISLLDGTALEVYDALTNLTSIINWETN